MQPRVFSRRGKAVQHDVLSEYLQIGDRVTGRRYAVMTSSLAQRTVACAIWTAGWLP